MLWTSDINPDRAPYNVLIKKDSLTDDSRDGRQVPFKLYYPDAPDLSALPVIVWSHGFGGNRDGAAFISRYIAGHGYVLVHLTHDGTDSSLWEGKPGHPWDILRALEIPRSATLDRFRDIPFALDALQMWAKDHPELERLMDFERLGMSGHSFGALTTQVMAGQHFPDINDTPQIWREERFKAGIAYSPVPVTYLDDSLYPKIYNSIDMPLLHMTGTDDSSPLKGFDYDHRLIIYEHTGHPEKYLLIKDDGDHMVYNGTRGKLKENPKRERHEDLIKVGSLAFWDAQLKNDQNAKDWLIGRGFTTYIGPDGTFKAEL